MAEARRWNLTATLQDVQFDWEDKPTPRTVRLTSRSPTPGERARIAMGGAEVEGVVVELSSGVLHVRLPKTQMKKAAARPRSRRKLAR